MKHISKNSLAVDERNKISISRVTFVKLAAQLSLKDDVLRAYVLLTGSNASTNLETKFHAFSVV